MVLISNITYNFCFIPTLKNYLKQKNLNAIRKKNDFYQREQFASHVAAECSLFDGCFLTVSGQYYNCYTAQIAQVFEYNQNKWSLLESENTF